MDRRIDHETRKQIETLRNSVDAWDLANADAAFSKLLRKALNAQMHLERKLDDHGIAKDSPARLRILQGGAK